VKQTHCMSGHPLRWITRTLAVCVPEHVAVWRDAGTYLVGEGGPAVRELVAAVTRYQEAYLAKQGEGK
jgi:hypothetical protein